MLNLVTNIMLHRRSCDIAVLRLLVTQETCIDTVGSTRDDRRWERLLDETCVKELTLWVLYSYERLQSGLKRRAIQYCPRYCNCRYKNSTKRASSRGRVATHDPLVKMAPYVAEKTKSQQHSSLSPKPSIRFVLCSAIASLPLPAVSTPPAPPAASQPSPPPTQPASSSSPSRRTAVEALRLPQLIVSVCDFSGPPLRRPRRYLGISSSTS